MKIKDVKLGIVGCGEFSQSFLDNFIAHPGISRIVCAEFLEERRNLIREKYKVDAVYASFDEMLEKEPDMNAVAIFAQRHQHGPLILQALKAGKNVMTAVPMGITVEEVQEIIKLVKQTGLVFMMAETCYYFPCAEYCRRQYQAGAFGEFVYGEAQYYHDIHEFAASFASAGEGWKRIAGIPPMFYATHSTAMLFTSANDHPVEVTCMGYEDKTGDNIYGVGVNNWDNPFSNQSALFRLSRGGIARINEFRRIGTRRPSSYITGFYGTRGAYEGSGVQHLFVKGALPDHPEAEAYDVSDEVTTYNFQNRDPSVPAIRGCLDYEYHCGFAPVQNTARLPKILQHAPLPNSGNNLLSYTGHNGSHAFLVDDFARAIVTGTLPPVNAWNGGYCTIAGLMAHESALSGGRPFAVPDLGEIPESFKPVDLTLKLWD